MNSLHLCPFVLIRGLTVLSYLCSCAFIGGSTLSCDRADSAKKQITLYTSIDEPIARPIIEAFEKQTGIDVILVTDTEASKSIGLAERLRAEKDRPRCDVWWGNEPFHTILLAEEGLFQPYDSPSAADVPAMYRDPTRRWAGNGLRARVIATHLQLECGNGIPISICDYPEMFVNGTFAIARPTAGTTGGHVSAIYYVEGEVRTDQFFRLLRTRGALMLGGNGPVAEAVARKDVSFGFTDNDDVVNVKRGGGGINEVMPGQHPSGAGTLMIPTTAALVANRPENIDAKKLIDYILSKNVEQELIKVQFAGWSIRGGANQPKAMEIDYVEVAKKMPEAVRRATAILEGREP